LDRTESGLSFEVGIAPSLKSFAAATNFFLGQESQSSQDKKVLTPTSSLCSNYN